MTAEHLGQNIQRNPIMVDGFAAMGKPIPFYRQEAGYRLCKDEWSMESDRAYECVAAVSEQLKRDKPYEARHAAMGYIDLTGAYRLIAVLLTAEALNG